MEQAPVLPMTTTYATAMTGTAAMLRMVLRVDNVLLQTAIECHEDSQNPRAGSPIGWRSTGIGRIPARLGQEARRSHGSRRRNSHPARTSFIIRIFAGMPTTWFA